MENLSNYITILQESLEKKREILHRLLQWNQKQEVLLQEDDLDAKAFDQTMRSKAELIDELLRLDEGFETTYERVKVDLEEQKVHYKEEIALLQEQITTIMDYTVQIQASEARNRNKVDAYFTRERKKIRGQRMGQKAALDYYKQVSKVNYIDPQLMDKKK